MTQLPRAVGHTDAETGNKYYLINDLRIDPDGKGNFTDGDRVGSLKSFKEQLINFHPEEETTGCETTTLGISGGKEHNPWETVCPALMLKHLDDNSHCIPAGFEKVLKGIYSAYGLDRESADEVATEFGRQVGVLEDNNNQFGE